MVEDSSRFFLHRDLVLLDYGIILLGVGHFDGDAFLFFGNWLFLSLRFGVFITAPRSRSLNNFCSERNSLHYLLLLGVNLFLLFKLNGFQHLLPQLFLNKRARGISHHRDNRWLAGLSTGRLVRKDD